ncbi:hypothetical protein BDZ91DRAFT_716717 [Kalaharituber pfeilii]|nr:hypothetical protein BDZ91DRAFT_716717 [Kalaharituber pfeilii]
MRTNRPLFCPLERPGVFTASQSIRSLFCCPATLRWSDVIPEPGPDQTRAERDADDRISDAEDIFPASSLAAFLHQNFVFFLVFPFFMAPVYIDV